MRSVFRPFAHRPASDAAVEDRRSHPRHPARQMFETSLGPIIDVSIAGIRILAEKRIEGRQRLTLVPGEDEITVEIRVVWCRQVEKRMYEVGCEFVGIDESVRGRIARLSARLIEEDGTET